MKNLKFDWKRKETYPKSNGLKVFGAFVCGGGSTMGFKLAGFDHFGGVEIDPKMAKIYELNHKPNRLYIEDIRDFDKKPIPFGKIVDPGCKTGKPKELWPSIAKRLPLVEYGDQNLKFADAKYRGLKTFNAFFSTNVLYDHEVPGTLTSSGSTVYWTEKRGLNDTELKRMSTFPTDFNFNGCDVRYVCGMSVPPFMMSSIAKEIKKQWF